MYKLYLVILLGVNASAYAAESAKIAVAFFNYSDTLVHLKCNDKTLYSKRNDQNVRIEVPGYQDVAKIIGVPGVMCGQWLTHVKSNDSLTLWKDGQVDHEEELLYTVPSINKHSIIEITDDSKSLYFSCISVESSSVDAQEVFNDLLQHPKIQAQTYL